MGIPPMLFFKRIVQEAAREPTRKERRGARRLAINPEFPLKAVLSFDRRGGTVAPMRLPGGSDWEGRLFDCSEVGARIVLSPAALACRGDICELRLSLGGIRLNVPCHVTNLRVESDGIHFGLQHELKDEAVRTAYRQLLTIVALGATLKPPTRKPRCDDSGYLVEEYLAGDGLSRLTIWRGPSDRSVSAFEFALKDCRVRAARGRPAEYFSGAKTGPARPATPAKALEIQRLFSWVVPNLASAVPPEARDFLRQYTG